MNVDFPKKFRYLSGMKFLRHTAILTFLGLAISGCGKKADAPPATPDPAAVSKVLLDSGKGAVLFVFPQYPVERREDWFTIINLFGDVNTDTLPRIPFADLSATLLLNIQPGEYNVRAAASLRGSPPYAGGNLKKLTVVAGTVAVLEVQRTGSDAFPFDSTQILRQSQPVWSLPNKAGFIDYIASISRSASRG
jgi:hypothetical protein